MKKLLFAIALTLGCLISTADARPLTMDEALDAVCRVNTNGARGSGTVFSECRFLFVHKEHSLFVGVYHGQRRLAEELCLHLLKWREV